jgi:hypothetical protein
MCPAPILAAVVAAVTRPGQAGCLLLAGALAQAACTPDFAEPNAFTRGEDAAGGGTAQQPPAGTDAAGGDVAAAPDGGVRADGGGAPAPGDARPSGRACDLGGRWLVAQRVMAVAIGQQQVAHNWFYYEIRQTGDDLVVERGLHCGFEVVKKTALAASVDSSSAWPALLVHNNSAGRRGRFAAEGGGCRLQLGREYTVRGATLPHYADPANALPGRNERADPAAGKPGWEDWDQDGQAGISLKVSSPLASGTLYTCQRDWTEYDGVTAAGADKLKVAIRYGGEQVALGRSAGSAQAIESSSTASSAAEEHYAYLHRLAEGQAAGTPEAICAAVRELRARLVPEANQ